MSHYTDAELEALLDDLESDKAERKESWSGRTPKKGRQAVCAFANDLPNHNAPGVLFVGGSGCHGQRSHLRDGRADSHSSLTPMG